MSDYSFLLDDLHKACEAELESLKEEEKRDRELIGFGTAAWLIPRESG